MPVLDKIMLIDDDPITSLLLEKVNASVHFAKEVLTFYSAVDGLDYLLALNGKKQMPPEVIFLDISMPIVSGWQFLERYKALGITEQQTAIYMLTASADQSDINRARKFTHVEDYLMKPLTAGHLQAIQAARMNTSSHIPIKGKPVAY